MKRIFLSILPFLLFFTSSFNNDFGGKKINSVDTIGYPITQFIGSDSALVKSRGGLMGRFAPIPFTDTTSANLSRISQYPGALIYTSSLDKYWYRNSSKTAWIEFTSSGGATVNIYNSNGILTSDRNLDGAGLSLGFHTLSKLWTQSDTLDIELRGNKIFTIAGLSSTQDTTTYKPVVIDPLTGRVLQSSYWFGGSGGGGGTTGIRFDSSYTPLGGKRGVDSFVVKSIRIRRNNVTVVPTEFGDSAAFWNIDVPDTISLSNRINAKADTSLVWKRGGNGGINPTVDWFGTPDSTILIAKLNGKTAWKIDPNGTYMRTTFGYMAGDSLTTGIRNTFFGYYAGGSVKTQGSNTAFGANALKLGTGGVAENVAVGYGALTRSQAIRNVGVGSNALTWLTTGKENTSVGNYSSLQNRNGEGNTALGSSALRGNVKGYFNTAVGIISLTQNTTAIDSINVVSGGSGYTTATVVISAPTVTNDPGLNSLQATATAVISGGAIVGVIVTEPGKGYTDVADGYSTPVTATITGDGSGAVLSVVLKSGQYNTGIGTSALANNRTGSNNVSVGFGSFSTQLYASNNVGLGYYAGSSVSGSYNVVIGGNSGDSIGSKNRQILIADGEGNIRFTSDSVGNSRTWGNGAHRFQFGTTAQRPSINPALFRYNTDSSKFEWSDGIAWYTVGSSSGSSGGVTSVATNTATGITGGTITTTGTIAADTAGVLSTRKYREKGIDSVQKNLTDGLATKLNTSDTASMLSGYTRVQRLLDSLANHTTRFNSVTSSLATKLNLSDTSAMLTNYTRRQELKDTAAAIRSAIGSGGGWGLTGNGSLTPGWKEGNFLGTTGNQSLLIKTNNILRARIDSLGSLGVFRMYVAERNDAYLDFGTTANTWNLFGSGAQVTTTSAFNVVSASQNTAAFYNGGVTVGSTNGASGTRFQIDNASSTLSAMRLSGTTLKTTPVAGDIDRDHSYLYVTLGSTVRQKIATDIDTLTFTNKKATLAAGSATAGTAPLKFTSGTPTTTPEIGAMHFNNGLFIADSSNSKRDTFATRSWVRSIASAGTGTVTSVAAGYGISGGTITTTGTHSLDSATVSAYYLRRKDSLTASNPLGYVTKKILADSLSARSYLSAGEGINLTTVVDTTTISIKYDTTALASFGAGAGLAGDTAAFSTSSIYGSFYNSGSDTLIITRLQIGLQGTSPSITATVYYNDSLNVTAGATKLVNAGSSATNIYTGTSVTSFDNTKIPPGVWVWVGTPTVTTKPTYFSLSLIGYKKRVTP